ncbi:D-alanyl-D-alanine carboxypeptidase, partial [Porphyromonas loveana]
MLLDRLPRITILSCLFLWVLFASAQDPTAVEIICNAERQTQARIGIEVRRCRDDSLVVAHRGDEQFCPASLVKLITSASILRLKGADMPFITRVGTDGSLHN